MGAAYMMQLGAEQTHVHQFAYTLKLFDVARDITSELHAAIGQLLAEFTAIALNHGLAPEGRCGLASNRNKLLFELAARTFSSGGFGIIAEIEAIRS